MKTGQRGCANNGFGAMGLAAATGLVWALACVSPGLAVAAPAAAPSGPAAPSPVAQSPVVQAQNCYAQGDFACVVRLLDPSAAGLEGLSPADQGERWRLLAFASARLDQRTGARQAFARWIRLSATHRLDRATTPPAVYGDYAAALLEVLGGEIERTPQLDHRAKLAVPAPGPADWPRFGPPPRSPRDSARDFLFQVGLLGSVHLRNDLGGPGDHVGALLGVELEPWQRWRFGAQFGVLRWVDQFSRARVLLQGRAGWALWARASHRLELSGLAGLGLSTEVNEGSVAAVAAAIRYHWQPANSAAGFYAELADQVGIASRTQHIAVLAIGLTLQPARSVRPRDGGP